MLAGEVRMTKILSIDGDRSGQLAMSVRLHAAGYEVVTAEETASVVNLAVRERPDIVILDISAPGGEGIRVANGIKSHPKTSGTTMILIAASGMNDLSEHAEVLGAVRVFTRPYDVNELIEFVKSVHEPSCRSS